MINRLVKHPLKARKRTSSNAKEGDNSNRKNAVITVELIEESTEESDNKTAEELLNWFKDDANFAPWAKTVKAVSVKEWKRSKMQVIEQKVPKRS